MEGKSQEGDDGKGQEPEDGNGQEGEDGQGEDDEAGNGQGGKENVAASLAAKSPGKVDKDGRPGVGGQGCVPRHDTDKYDKRNAKVKRLNLTAAVITMLKGLAQGEKRKVEYKWLELWSVSQKVFCRWCLLLRVSGQHTFCGRPCAANGGEPLGA